jgi:hypothetical protein
MIVKEPTPLEKDEKHFLELIQRLNNITKYRDLLLATDFDELKEKNRLFYWKVFITFYQAFCFFPDNEIKSKLKFLGLKDEDFLYFTSLAQILQELNIIWADENIIPAKSPVLEFIRFHYETKLFSCIIKRLGFTAQLNGKKDATQLKKALYNIKRRRVDDRKGGLKSFKTFLDEYAYSLLMTLDKVIDTPEENQNFMLSMCDGNTKSFLRDIVESHYYIDMTKDAFLRKFYPLFRLIVKDGPYLPDEDGFYELGGYVEKSFEAFQTIKVKDIIY